MRALSDQMEPPPPQVQELRAALAVYRRAAEEWRERAEKAEAEIARLKSDLSIERHNLAISEYQVAQLRTFIGGRALNTPFDVPPDESLKPDDDDKGRL